MASKRKRADSMDDCATEDAFDLKQHTTQTVINSLLAEIRAIGAVTSQHSKAQAPPVKPPSTVQQAGDGSARSQMQLQNEIQELRTTLQSYKKVVLELRNENQALRGPANFADDDTIARELDTLYYEVGAFVNNWFNKSNNPHADILFVLDKSTQWLARQMPNYNTDKTRAYVVKVLVSLLMCTVINNLSTLTPFGFVEGLMTASLAQVTRSFQGLHDRNAFQKWLFQTRDIQRSIGPEVLDAAFVSKCNSITSACVASLGIIVQDELQNKHLPSLEKTARAAARLSELMVFHNARFRFSCKSSDRLNGWPIYDNTYHRHVSMSGFTNASGTHTVSDWICPGLFKLRDDHGQAITPPLCIWKARVLAAEAPAEQRPAPNTYQQESPPSPSTSGSTLTPLHTQPSSTIVIPDSNSSTQEVDDGVEGGMPGASCFGTSSVGEPRWRNEPPQGD